MKRYILLLTLFVFSLGTNGQFLAEKSMKNRALSAENDLTLDEMKSFGFSSENLPSKYSLKGMQLCLIKKMPVVVIDLL